MSDDRPENVGVGGGGLERKRQNRTSIVFSLAIQCLRSTWCLLAVVVGLLII